MKIIVFGSTGYIGRNLVKALDKNKYEVTAVLRNESDLFSKEVKEEIIDLSNQSELRRIIKNKDIVINCLGNTKLHLNSSDRRYVEIELTTSIANISKSLNVKQYIQLSTIKAFGSMESPFVNEHSQCKPKYEFEQVCYDRENLIKDIFKDSPTNYTILRAAGALGKDEPVFRQLIKNTLKGKFSIIGNGTTIISMMDIRDLISAFKFSIMNDSTFNELFLIKGFETTFIDIKTAIDRSFKIQSSLQSIPLTLAKFIATILEFTVAKGKDIPFNRFAVSTFSTSIVMDDSKIRSLGFEPKYQLDDSINSICKSL